LYVQENFRMSVRVSFCHALLLSGVLCGCGFSNDAAPGNTAGAANGGASAAGSSSVAGNTAAGATSFAGNSNAGAGGGGTVGGSSAGGASAGSTSAAGNTSGGSSGAAPSGGAAGAMTHPGQSFYPPVASQRKAPEFTLPAPANPTGLILRYMNNCPQTLWVHAAGIPGGVVQLPGRVAGQPPTEQVYDWPGLGGRMTVYEDTDNGYQINFFEMNADRKALNVNLSNVDWVGLPVEIRSDTKTKCLTGCYQPLAKMLDGCPPQLLDATHKVCTAPKNWCANATNAKDPLCSALDAAGAAIIATDPKCAFPAGAAAAGTGAAIYGCAGGPGGNLWNQSAYCCAKANRGYLTDVNDPGNDNTQNANYYKTMPYNTYAAYSQTMCPYIYSFAYDDYNDQSGIQGCIGATEMDVTWCPGDP
jgi:hypothetical protein